MKPNTGRSHSTALECMKNKLESDGASKLLIRTFLPQYKAALEGKHGYISTANILPLDGLPDQTITRHNRRDGHKALGNTAVIKLNGGLGTSMGLNQAKCLLPVKRNKSFLDVIVEQTLKARRKTGRPIPLVFMNSKNTEFDTLEALDHYPDLKAGQSELPPLSFLQNRVPKIRVDTLEPIKWESDPSLEWCPPGHGDLYVVMVTAGLLDKLLKGGFRYAFVSNSDNLGATLDLGILGFFAANQIPFLMEVALRSEADKKGGHLASKSNGRLLLRERAQCPPKEIEQFEDINRFRYFNTNNLWIDLSALNDLLCRQENILELSRITNQKTVDPLNPLSPPVYQFETAMGSAISLFSGAKLLQVDRSRFIPVKTTNDLLGLWSDVFTLNEEMELVCNIDQRNKSPTIRLDHKFYGHFNNFVERFPNGAPSLLKCNNLVVEGDIRFGHGVVLEGNIHFRNRLQQQAHISDNEHIIGSGDIINYLN